MKKKRKHLYHAFDSFCFSGKKKKKNVASVTDLCLHRGFINKSGAATDPTALSLEEGSQVKRYAKVHRCLYAFDLTATSALDCWVSPSFRAMGGEGGGEWEGAGRDRSATIRIRSGVALRR